MPAETVTRATEETTPEASGQGPNKANYQLRQGVRIVADLMQLADQYSQHFGQVIVGQKQLFQKAVDWVDQVARITALEDSKIIQPTPSKEENASFCKKCGTSVALHEISILCPK